MKVPSRFHIFAGAALTLCLWLMISFRTSIVESARMHLPQSTNAASRTPELSRLQPGELVMITATSGTKGFLGTPDVKNMIYENRLTYARKWGHHFMWADMGSYEFDKVAWNKVPIIRDAQQRYPDAKWFWWLDADIILMNSTIDVYDHVLSPRALGEQIRFDEDIPKSFGGSSGFRSPATLDPAEVNMLISWDYWGMNTGSFIMRRSAWTDIVLEIWADPLVTEKDFFFHDQDGFVHIWQHHEFVRNHTALVQQKALNAYPSYNELGDHYSPGDPVVHFAGCSAGNLTHCAEQWHGYWNQRKADDTPAWIVQEIRNGSAKIEYYKPGVALPDS